MGFIVVLFGALLLLGHWMGEFREGEALAYLATWLGFELICRLLPDPAPWFVGVTFLLDIVLLFRLDLYDLTFGGGGRLRTRR